MRPGTTLYSTAEPPDEQIVVEAVRIASGKEAYPSGRFVKAIEWIREKDIGPKR